MRSVAAELPKVDLYCCGQNWRNVAEIPYGRFLDQVEISSLASSSTAGSDNAPSCSSRKVVDCRVQVCADQLPPVWAISFRCSIGYMANLADGD